MLFAAVSIPCIFPSRQIPLVVRLQLPMFLTMTCGVLQWLFCVLSHELFPCTSWPLGGHHSAKANGAFYRYLGPDLTGPLLTLTLWASFLSPGYHLCEHICCNLLAPLIPATFGAFFNKSSLSIEPTAIGFLNRFLNHYIIRTLYWHLKNLNIYFYNLNSDKLNLQIFSLLLLR